MEKRIRHVHERAFVTTLGQAAHAIDQLWSGSAGDALPAALHGWRRTPAGSQGLALGTRFGHGPFSFVVEQWDGHTLRARIETAGFRGQHGFVLRAQGERVLVTHDLDAQLGLPQWLLWQLLVAAGHDWAVEAMLDRLGELLASPRGERVLRTAPRRMQLFAQLNRLVAGLTSRHEAASARASRVSGALRAGHRVC